MTLEDIGEAGQFNAVSPKVLPSGPVPMRPAFGGGRPAFGTEVTNIAIWPRAAGWGMAFGLAAIAYGRLGR